LRRRRPFPQACQRVGGTPRPLRHPPKCSSIARSSAGGVFRAAPALRTAFARCGRGPEARRLRPYRTLSCCRFRRHRVRCFCGTGGGSWNDGSLHASSSSRRSS